MEYTCGQLVIALPRNRNPFADYDLLREGPAAAVKRGATRPKGVAARLALGSAVALGAVWIGYPLAVAAAASLRRRRRQAAGPAEAVSVVLATRAPCVEVRERVDDLLRSEYDPHLLEVIVAFDAEGGDPRCEVLAAADPRIRVVRGDSPGGKAATLNAGVRAARGTVLVFADTYQRFHPAAVRRLAAAVRDGGTPAATGRLELPRGSTGSLIRTYWKFERVLRRLEGRIHSPIGVTGAVYAVRREVWPSLPAGLILDDVFVPLKLVLQGYRVAFVNDAYAFETRPSQDHLEYARKVRTLTGNFQLCALLPGLLSPRRNPVWLQFVFHKLLRLTTPYLLLATTPWLASEARHALRRLPKGVAVGLGVAVTGGMYFEPGTVLRCVSLLREGALLQAAVVRATWNGARGKWNVWS